ncbi:uncharacterized protein LOC8259792 [Ricinus communis]|uniref:uncharacterized protein LOC8259792 n=1 Tax=Ricinus communis TaxID=3988 RepID=UPI000772696D|nr:uncharacterized protein LOC8259792 [Ricinus communis]|eukprot:XP_002524097.2 uncharacterized protein LOC8259792 [Ricinus communis]
MVSGSVVLIARQVHKRLVSDFMKKIECELMGRRLSLSSSSCQEKKRVRFAENVIEPSGNNKEYRNKNLVRISEGDNVLKIMEDVKINQRNYGHGAKLMEAMPLNRQVLYKGILEYRTLKGCNDFSSA